MFLAIPLENRPTWRNPPWLTLLLILLNVIVYCGPQRSEEAKLQRATEFYFSSKLPAIELPAYVEYLHQKQSKHFVAASQWKDQQLGPAVLRLMEDDDTFAIHLDTTDGNTKAVLAPTESGFAQWQTERRAYEQRKPPAFTLRWSLKYGEGIGAVSWTWLTSAFLHGSVGHLIGNMVFLFLFGFPVEMALGRARFLAFYLLGALGSSALCAVAYAHSTGHGLGASGAISCVMVLYALLYRLRSIKFFYMVFFYFNYVRAPALILVPLWIANEVVSWVFVHANVAYAAHLGGMFTGLLLAQAMPSQEKIDRTLSPVDAKPEPTTSAADLAAQAHALVGKMQWLPACELWKKALQLSPNDHSILYRYFNTARHARNDAHMAFICHAIFTCRSGHASVIELQKECWRWSHKSARQVLLQQEPLLLNMVQRWAALGSSADTDALLLDLQKSCEALPPWLDAVERYVVSLVKTGQTAVAQPWIGILQQRRPQAAVLTTLPPASPF